MATEYNGHPSWEHWNVALWIGNDEGLYECALTAIRGSRTLDDAAAMFIDLLGVGGEAKTPDGAPYSHEYVVAALEGLED